MRVHGVSQFPIYKDLGAGIYMTRMNWWQVAPTRPADPTNPNDPAYQWPAEVDDAVQQAAQYGMRITMELSDSPGLGERRIPATCAGRPSARRTSPTSRWPRRGAIRRSISG